MGWSVNSKLVVRQIKRKIKVTLVSVLTVITVFYACLFFYANYYNVLRAYYISGKFFNNLVDQNYHEASNNIFFFGSTTSNSLSQTELKSQWEERVQSMQRKGVYAVSYNNLTMKKDDGDLIGRVTVTMRENDLEKDYNLIYYFGSSSHKLGIAHFELLYSPTVTASWMETLSGNFPTN